MKKYSFLLLIPFLWGCPVSLNDILQTTPISNEEIARGLKQALNLGVNDAVNFLSQDAGFYTSSYKILLPDEVRVVTEKLSMIPGFAEVEDILIKKINSAASDAVSKATPIMIDAISSMSFQDVMEILLGTDDAATQYLHKTSYEKLYNAFQPILYNSLEEFQVVSYWKNLITQYNNLPFLPDVNPRIDDHIARECLVALFDLVEIKEKKIRTDISERKTQLLQRVFAKQD